MKGPIDSPQSPRHIYRSSVIEEVDFSEYIWMANELEEFDRKVEMEFWEEVFIEACFEEMWEEEDEEWFYPDKNKNEEKEEEEEHIKEFYQNCLNEQANSRLNPLANEFFPRSLEMEIICDEASELR